jgi:ADP-L-glycero-D-manno-heptose 6-epimerase
MQGKQKVVVTGANGFIGGAIVNRLLAGGHEVICVDYENTRCPARCTFIDPHTFVNEEIWRSNFQADAIIHQGACSDTMNHDRDFMMKSNYDYSRFILSACNTKNIRLIYASSAAVYGEGTQGFLENLSLDTPLNVYAESKLMFDSHVKNQVNLKAQVVGLRYFNVYGSNESHKGRMASVIYHFHKQYQELGAIKPFVGSENFYRDFVYIDDIVNMNMFFLKNQQISGIFNAGSGIERSFGDIAKIISEISGCKITPCPFPEELKGKYQEFTRADMTSLISVGYDIPSTTLENGVADYWSKLS